MAGPIPPTESATGLDADTPETAESGVEAWAERYLDLFQRNWTAWLESTPGMIRAALASAEQGDEPAVGDEPNVEDAKVSIFETYVRNR